ncbi:MAG: tRNA (adenine(22)-N(1))-methyltransferase [Lachnospiraceae bacterium]
MIQKTINLSKRLCTIASFAEIGSRVADIGTDHAYIPIYLIQQGLADHAIAMDIGKGPLLRAREHIARYGLAEHIETRLSDGLQQLLPGEADTVIIAGMGGELMLRIITAGSHVKESVNRWILSPQSELEEFRRGLEALGLTIGAETMLCEEDKYYTVMLAEPGPMHYPDDWRYRYGDLLIREHDPVLAEYLIKEEQTLLKIKAQLSGQQSDGAYLRLQEVTEALRQVRETYDAMQ